MPIWSTVLESNLIHTINEARVQEFHLKELPIGGDGEPHKDIPLIGATGGDEMEVRTASKKMGGGTLYELGDCQLAGLPPPPMTFVRNLSAAALPFASPVGVGLLGLPLFWTFPAGVEFDWHGTDGDPPTIIFYFGQENCSLL